MARTDKLKHFLVDIADKIRIALDKVGIVLKDSKEGTVWEVK